MHVRFMHDLKSAAPNHDHHHYPEVVSRGVQSPPRSRVTSHPTPNHLFTYPAWYRDAAAEAAIVPHASPSTSPLRSPLRRRGTDPFMAQHLAPPVKAAGPSLEPSSPQVRGLHKIGGEPVHTAMPGEPTPWEEERADREMQRARILRREEQAQRRAKEIETDARVSRRQSLVAAKLREAFEREEAAGASKDDFCWIESILRRRGGTRPAQPEHHQAVDRSPRPLSPRQLRDLRSPEALKSKPQVVMSPPRQRVPPIQPAAVTAMYRDPAAAVAAMKTPQNMHTPPQQDPYVVRQSASQLVHQHREQHHARSYCNTSSSTVSSLTANGNNIDDDISDILAAYDRNGRRMYF
eukprot:PhM_4_TR2284/c0_g1_i1/m.100979